MKYWVKGGLIGFLAPIAFFIIDYLIRTEKPFDDPVLFLVVLIYWGRMALIVAIIGTIVGLIVEKYKSKK